MLIKYKVLSVIFLAVVLFGSNISSYPLKNWDEAWYGEISKNMALKGTGFLMPYWNGDYYFDKPPLYFWLTIPVVKAFGIGEWQMRIVSVLAAVGAIIVLYFIAKKLFNEKVAVWSTLIFLSFGQVVERFGSGNLDALMISLMLLAMLCYLNSKLFWAGVFVGLTALSKGIAFILYPIVVISLLELFRYKALRLKLILVPAVAALISGTWVLVGVITFGQKFLNVYIGDPLSGNLSWRGEGFSPVLINTLLRDTSIFVIPALVILFIFRNKIKKYIPIIFALLIASILIFIPLNFFADKIGWYLLPIYPLLALIAGFAFFQIHNNFQLQKKYMHWLLICLSVFTLQFLMHTYINLQTPDRSLVSATLGREVKDFSGNLGKEIILEDNDFASFLYYSDIGKVRSLQKNTKPSEWWIINYDQMNSYLAEGKPITLITQHPAGWEKMGFIKKANLSFGHEILEK